MCSVHVSLFVCVHYIARVCVLMVSVEKVVLLQDQLQLKFLDVHVKVTFQCSGDLTRHQHFCGGQHLDHGSLEPSTLTVLVEGSFIGREISPGIHLSARQHTPDPLVIIIQWLPKDTAIICG